jgi:sugar lactone lactonase YvrE
VLYSTPELIANYRCVIGENPIWHAVERKLYWTDIVRGRLFRYDPRSGEHETCYEGRPVGGFTIQADGSLLLFMDRGTIAQWRDGALSVIVDEIPEERLSRFNDVIADPRGRVFCGTMSVGNNNGRLYRVDLDGSIHLVMEAVGCPNGMGFSSDCQTFYFTDSFARSIYSFKYEENDASVQDRKIFTKFNQTDGMPDGMTVDATGKIWCALWDGACVVQLDNCGRISRRLPVPAHKTSSLTFGGEGYDEMYITTSGGDQSEDEGFFPGALFCLKIGFIGRPEFQSRILIP